MTDDGFHRSWQRAWQGMGATGSGADTCSMLLNRYAEPQRRYHTQQHLAECLAVFEPVRELPPHPAEVEMALWFHDAVYEVRRADNELASAELAQAALLAAGARPQACAQVHELIMATRHTAVPVTMDEQVLIDIDLSILSTPQARFDEYERQIGEEYAHVPRWLFRMKRRTILRSFLKRPRIYSTAHFFSSLEEAARHNLRVATGERAA